MPGKDERGRGKRGMEAPLFRPRTEIGQNFLHDPGVVRFMTESIAPGPEDRILEVGPGQGILSRGLLGTPCGALLAVELDRRLEPYLADLREDPRFELHFGDALTTDLARCFSRPPNRLVANLPYHITTPLLFKVLEELAPGGLRDGLVMVQLEAGRRIVAPPGSRERCPLGVLLEALGEARIVRRVGRGAFRPIPEVESCLVTFRIERNRDLANDGAFRLLLRAGFAQRRKTLANALSSGLRRDRTSIEQALALSGFDARIRAEALPLEGWFRLRDRLGEELKEA